MAMKRRLRSLALTARIVAPIAVLSLAAMLLTAALIYWEQTRGLLAFDLKLAFGERLVGGEPLYPTEGEGALGYPYPPFLAVLLTPLVVLPTVAAQYVGVFLCVVALASALWVVRVRDPYCFAAALLSTSVVWSARMGNASAFVTLLVALAYRFGSAPTGLAIAVKLYAWPLLVWGVVTRGRRDLAIGIGVAAAAILVPWAGLRFEAITRYVSIVRTTVEANEALTYSLPLALAIPITGFAFLGMWFSRHDRPASFSFAVLAMLAASPLLWVYYFTAVLIPLGIRRPSFSVAWLIPVAAWWEVSEALHAAAMLLLVLWCAIGAPTLARPSLAPWLSLGRLRRSQPS